MSMFGSSDAVTVPDERQTCVQSGSIDCRWMKTEEEKPVSTRFLEREEGGEAPCPDAPDGW